jgi:signal transduction histidine kinase
VVADNGIGIAQEYHNRILKNSSGCRMAMCTMQKGYGLGLSYVSHVVEQHNGTIEVLSEEGAGSRFIITLPKQRRIQVFCQARFRCKIFGCSNFFLNSPHEKNKGFIRRG